jgi:hypothetical protein
MTMIELSQSQEQKIQRQDCRTWLELVARHWYASTLPGAESYPVSVLIEHLKRVYFSCQRAGIEDIEATSLLGFNVLRANTLRFDEESITGMIDFFIQHVALENMEYAQNWIDLQFEEAQ